MKTNTEMKPEIEEMSENELDQVNGGFHDWTPADSDPKQADRNEILTEEAFPGSLTLLKPNPTDNALKNEKLSETETVSRVRSNNIRNRRV